MSNPFSIVRRNDWPKIGIEFEHRRVRFWLLVTFAEVEW